MQEEMKPGGGPGTITGNRAMAKRLSGIRTASGDFTMEVDGANLGLPLHLMNAIVEIAKALPRSDWQFTHGKLFSDRIQLNWKDASGKEVHRWASVHLVKDCQERLPEFVEMMLLQAVNGAD